MSLPKGPRTAVLNVKVTPELLARFKAEADARGIKRSDYLEEVLERVLQVDEAIRPRPGT
jgi:predicted DNA binding CopG/RHH family protein